VFDGRRDIEWAPDRAFSPASLLSLECHFCGEWVSNEESDLKGGRREPGFFGCYYPEADYL
jgi:hypothetical protein